MKRNVAILPGLMMAGLMLLTACGKEPEPAPTSGGQGNAAGEVLPGSVSDAMLALDTIETQAPSQQDTAPQETAAQKPAGDAASGEGDPAANSDSAADSAEPAAAPSPSP